MSKKRYLIVFIIICILVGGSFVYKNVTNTNPTINNILSNSAYAYLPDEAKEYVMDVYNATGELILT